MQKVNVSYRDLDKWIRSRTHELHAQVQFIWDAGVEYPTVKISTEKDIQYDEEDKTIYFGAGVLSRGIEKWMNCGLCKTVDEYLSGCFAEEDTHYTSHVLVPENFSVDQMMKDALYKTDSGMFFRALNIGAQIEGIGKVGHAEVISSLNPNYSLLKEYKLRVEAERNKRSVKEARAQFQNVLTILPKRIPGSISFLEKTPEIKVHDRLSSLIMTDAGIEVGIILQEKFSGKLPELIRKKLDQDSIFDQAVINAIDSYGAREFYDYLGLHIR